MGLAGRKTKQRIGSDPRNLSWSTDTSKFGAKYLQSLGWTSGTGLGLSGDGRTSNLKIHQKLDLMGIGANRRRPDGDDMGWRAGCEFEGLLARLNQAQSSDTQNIPMDEDNGRDNIHAAIDHSINESQSTTRSEEVIGHLPEPNSKEKGDTRRKGEAAHKKRKRSVTENEDADAKEAKRRRKEEKREKKKQSRAAKVAKKLKIDDISKCGPGNQAEVGSADNVKDYAQNTQQSSTGERAPSPTARAVRVIPRYRAHRARNIASKRLAAVSAIGMNEILGVSCKLETSTASFTALSPKPKGDEGQTWAPRHNSTTSTGPSEQAASSHSASGGLGFRSVRERDIPGNDGNDQLRKSGKSVAEYFAEKMARMRCTAKKAPAFDGAKNEQRKKDEQATDI